jgi:nitrite reductase (NADH) large subunit
VRWENRLGPQVTLFSFVTAASVPLLLSLATLPPLKAHVGPLAELVESHLFRQITGFCLLGLVVLEVFYAVRKRTRRPVPGSRAAWRSVHMLVGCSMVPLVIVHTGGRWGDNLNGLLLTALLAAVVVGAGGKLVEAVRVQAVARRAAAGKPLSKKARGWLGPFHERWLRLHVLTVTALLVFVAFHIFSVYYF